MDIALRIDADSYFPFLKDPIASKYSYNVHSVEVKQLYIATYTGSDKS